MKEDEQFSFAFNSGIAILMSLLKELEGDKLKAAIFAAEQMAMEQIEATTGLPAEDIMTRLEPHIADLRKRVIEM